MNLKTAYPSPVLKVGVKDLVDFACRKGDLLSDGVAGPSAREGVVAHKKIQADKASTEQAEVSLAVEFACCDVKIKVSGRLDLLDLQQDTPVVSEIKSSFVPPEHLPDAVRDLQWAQLKVYGYLVCRTHSAAVERANCDDIQTVSDNLQSFSDSELNQDPDQYKAAVCLRLLTINLRDNRVYTDKKILRVRQLHEFFFSVLEAWTRWQLVIAAKRDAMRASAKALTFPFGEFRQGQYQMAASVYRSMRDGNNVLCEAPTGIGKTISSLFPACKALGEEHVSQITYLTAKTSGRKAAFDAIKILRKAGLDASTLVIHSKSLSCHCLNGSCERLADGRCPKTIGFFDRLPAARRDLIERQDMDDLMIDQVAAEHDICPFELSLQMLRWVDIVICDYNYVFDPLVRLTSFIERERSIGFLIDEAHNLGDRARGMYSARLGRRQNLQVIKACEGSYEGLTRAARSLNRALARAVSSADETPAALLDVPATVRRAVDKCLEEITGGAGAGGLVTGAFPEPVWDWFKELYRFHVIEQLYSDTHRTLIETEGQGRHREISLRLTCLDARLWLKQSFDRLHGAAVFSATLRPGDYHARVLGLDENSSRLSLPSPFASAQMACMICRWIDTRFRARGQSTHQLVQLIHDTVTAKQGNYLVFFPSYAYMEMVYLQYVERHPHEDVIVQIAGGDAEHRAEFLDKFVVGGRAVGFAITAGVFGEGIDYLGDALIGAIIVGTGLPGLGLQQQLLQRQFEQDGLNGFDYAYRYPGFTKVLQAAGRVIRSESDRGVVLLVDDRFDEPFYKVLFPQHWIPQVCRDPQELSRQLDRFWSAG